MTCELLYSIIVSTGAALWGIYVYFVHERKLSNQQKRLNEQQELLNEYQLAKNREEENNKKKALIEASIIGAVGNRYIVIHNKGLVSAFNIRWESPEIKKDGTINILIPNRDYPIKEISAAQFVRISLNVNYGHQNAYRIKFIWDDESGKDRFQEQSINL